jgi:hypothetical protein
MSPIKNIIEHRFLNRKEKTPLALVEISLDESRKNDLPTKITCKASIGKYVSRDSGDYKEAQVILNNFKALLIQLINDTAAEE